MELAAAFDTSPNLWLNLQQKYDLWIEENQKTDQFIKPVYKTTHCRIHRKMRKPIAH